MPSNSLGEEAPHMGPGGRQRDKTKPDAAGSTRRVRPGVNAVLGLPAEDDNDVRAAANEHD